MAKRIAGSAARPPDYPVGISEISELFHVERETVDQWRYRKVLPPEDGTVSGTPWWWRSRIVRWGRETGRD